MEEKTKKTLKIVAVVVLVITIAAVAYYLLKGGGAATDWRIAAKKKLSDAGIVYSPFSGITDWNQYAGWIKVNVCGMGGGDPDTPCYNAAQPKVTQFFTELDVQPTDAIMNKLKAEILAFNKVGA